jgi:hypothetical protein
MAATEPSGFTKIKDFLWGGIKSGTNEIITLIPDSILFGSLFLYFLTSNASFGVFGVFVLESILSYKFISWMISQTVGESRPPGNIKCLSGYKTPRFDPSKILPIHAYPPFAIFSVTSMATYIGIAMSSFKEVFETMGPEWQSRSTVSYILLSILMILTILVRSVSGCDTFGDMAISVMLGIIVGLIFYYVNKSLFGQEGINFLGVPTLVNKAGAGAPIYVCGATKDDSSVHYS